MVSFIFSLLLSPSLLSSFIFSLASILLILLIFLRTSSWFHWFSWDLLPMQETFSFINFWNNYFLLIASGLYWSYFSSFLKWKLRLLMLDLSFFKKYLYIYIWYTFLFKHCTYCILQMSISCILFSFIEKKRHLFFDPCVIYKCDC